MMQQGYDQSVFVRTVMFGTIALVLLTILTNIPVLGLLFVCLWIFVYPAIGAAYGRYSRREGYRAEVLPTALWGGAAAAVSSIVPTILGVIIAAAVNSGDDAAAATLFGGPIAICFGLGVSFILGAIGGALYGAFVP